MKIMEVIGECKLYKIIGDESFKKHKQEVEENLYADIIKTMNYFEIKQIEQIKIFLFEDAQDFKNVTKFPYQVGPLAGAYNGYGIRVYCDLEKASIEDLYNCIIHEVIHTLYKHYVLSPNNLEHIVWLGEGLAQNLSNEKEYLKDNENLKKFIQKNIYSEDKIIPDINYLKTHGNKFGSFVDSETHKYNGYAWSYLIVRYLMECQEQALINIIRNPNQIKAIESTLIEETLNYYKQRLEVDNHDKMDERTRRGHI